MIEPQDVIDEARTWLGTRFLHQQAVKGHGCDCIGLIRGVAQAKGLVIDEDIWRRFRNYGRVPNPAHMIEALRAHLVPVDREQIQLADILYLEWRRELPTHLAFVGEFQGRRTLIHALAEAGHVVEHGFVDPWPERLNSAWRLPIVKVL